MSIFATNALSIVADGKTSERHWHGWSLRLSAAAILIGFIAILGWVFDVAAFKSIYPEMATMKANVAICLIALGIALTLSPTEFSLKRMRHPLAASSFAIFTLVISIVTLLQFIFGTDWGIDQLLFLDTDPMSMPYPGRMSAGSTICIGLLSIAVLLMQVPSLRSAGQGFAVVSLLFSLGGLIGYLYNLPSLYGLLFYTQMALHSIIGFAVLSIAVLFLDTSRGIMSIFTDPSPGGSMARRVLPGAILLPIVIGWIVQRGVAEGYYDITIAIELLVLFNIAAFSVFIGGSAIWIHNAEKQRALTEKRLLESEIARTALEREKVLINLKEELIATVSHDFRTPLTVILSSTELMTRYDQRMTSEQRAEHCKRIQEQAQFMTQLLEDVLTFSKVKAGRLEYRLTRMNLSDFVRPLFESMQMQATVDHHFTFTASGELDDVLMDERILQRILVNLLSNAIRYSPAGGEIWLNMRRDDDDIEFTIRDQGIGIPTDDLPHIFEPFRRARNTDGIEGTGLGMAIVYESLTVLGGNIRVDSTVNQGTTFTVRLPYLRADDRPPTP